MLLYLIRKEFLTTRWVHLVAALMGLGFSVVAYLEPDAAVFMMLFTFLMYTHLLFNQCRFAAANRADNVLLNSLPLRRSQVVAGKYGFVLTCSLGFAAYASLLMGALSLLGVPRLLPPLALFALMVVTGILYHSLLMPLSYVGARYGTWASMIIYLAIIILPQQLGKGQQKGGEAIADLLSRLVITLGSGWALVLLALALLALLGASYMISVSVYRKAEF